eukprot:1593270-Pyramimonas_sp.AAC.1
MDLGGPRDGKGKRPVRQRLHEHRAQTVDHNGARRARDSRAKRLQNGLGDLSRVAAVQLEPVQVFVPRRRAKRGHSADAAQCGAEKKFSKTALAAG